MDVLRQGSQVEVMSPLALRERVTKGLEEALTNYRR